MDSLLGYGVSSESDSDGDHSDGHSPVKQTDEGTSTDAKTRNFLLTPGSASSGSSSDSEPENIKPAPAPLKPPSPERGAVAVQRQVTLPSPSLGSNTPSKLPPPPLSASSDSSVFANPFKALADQKLNALQKHVPLTMQAKPAQIGGKRICASYRKDGRCRFGIKCKYAHDSDLQNTVVPPMSQAAGSKDALASTPENSHSEGSEETEDVSGGPQGKKRRVGLSNTMIPPKKAMKQFARQRDRERLNMSR